MKLGELCKDICLECGKSHGVCACEYNPLLKLGFKVPGGPTIREVNEWAVQMVEQDKQAFFLLYNTLLEVGDIIQRGIREGERGHKKALHDAMAVLRRVE